jgi:hypothetical protein
MRKIVTRGLYTYMDGMCPGTNFAGNVEMNEPLKQDKNKSLEGLCVVIRNPRSSVTLLAIAAETTMLNGNSGHKETSPCHFSKN